VSVSKTRAELLSERIADEILAGALPPGLHLDEQVLARRFGVSRTPVRDALRLLSGTGLIDIRPRLGATVRTVTAEELDTLFVAMGEIEASCARLATLCMSRAERAALRAHHEAMASLAAAGDRDAYVEANLEFHGLLYAGAHNPAIEEIARALRRRLMPYRRAQFQAPGRLARSHAEHDVVVRAVLARDTAGANAAMLVHMSVVEDVFVDLAGAARRPVAPPDEPEDPCRGPGGSPLRGGSPPAARPARNSRKPGRS
jgi:DNA-binding GntR family transcriptional regulator